MAKYLDYRKPNRKQKRTHYFTRYFLNIIKYLSEECVLI